ncbi:hypothetical protein ACOMHN_050969 [Nucella lapillus]
MKQSAPTYNTSGVYPVSFPRQCTSKVKRGGGLAFITKDSIAEHCTTSTDFTLPHLSFELAKLDLTTYQQRASFYLVYRPPPSKGNELHFC